MTHISDLPRRRRFGAAVGLLVLSACSTATTSSTASTPTPPRAPDPTPATAPVASPTTTSPSTTTTTIGSTTTTSTTVTPTTTVPDEPTSVAAVDVAGGTVFGLRVFEAVDVDTVAADVSARLGAPTADSDWQPTTGATCAGSTDIRVLWWGDFRMTFERYQGDGDVRDELSAWTVGDPTVVALVPHGDVPPSFPSDIVTLEGIGLGSSRSDIDAAWANVHNGGNGRLVVVDRGATLSLTVDADGRIIGFGSGPFDCPVDESR